MSKCPRHVRAIACLRLTAILLVGALPQLAYGQEFVKIPFAEAVTGKHVAKAQISGKVSPLLTSVISEIEARGITRETARRRGASALSNPLVKVNEDGAIQTYIHVSRFGNAEKKRLAGYEVTIEIANEELGIDQGWIPLDRIDVWNSIALWIASRLPDAKGWFG